MSQAADLSFLPVEATFEVARGRLKVDPATYATNVRGVFAAGDFVTGPATLIEAAGHGKKCAYAIDRYLGGRVDVTVAANVKITVVLAPTCRSMYDVLPRQHIPMLPVESRMAFREPDVDFTTGVELGFSATHAVAESTRCLMCNYNIWFDPVPVRPVRRLRRRLPGGRHPHDRRQPDEDRRGSCPSSRRPTAGRKERTP